jgi:hypothetical protein
MEWEQGVDRTGSLSLDKRQTPERLFWDGKKRELISFYTLILAFLIKRLRP